MALPWRRKAKQTPPITIPEPSVLEQRTANNLAIASAVEAAITATNGHSQLALGVAVMARDHYVRYGEKPKLRGLVATSHWPIVLVAQPVGIAKVVTRYIITHEGDVTLERDYTQKHIYTTRESNVFTSIPPRL